MTEFVMPSLGADMEQGKLLEWLVKPGDTVHRGDIVAVVDTSKAAVEVEVFSDGVVEELLVDVGTTVPVGAPLARLSGSTPVPAAAEPSRARPPVASTPPRSAAPQPRVPEVAPLARRMAADLGIDTDTLTGTGLHGRVTRDDVVRAAAATHPPEAAVAVAVSPPLPRLARATPYARRLAEARGLDLDEVAGLVAAGQLHASRADGVLAAADIRHAAELTPPPPARPAAGSTTLPIQSTLPPGSTTDRSQAMRAAIAALMARSKREIPHYYLTETADLSAALAWMTERNRDLPISQRLVPAALLLRAVALAARRHPELNGFWVDGAFVPGTGVHLGVAISLRGGGLIAPALHDADTLGVEELMARMRDLVTRARGGRLRSSEMSDPTLTVTNLGERGVESVTGVIYPPQVALVGIGRVVERPYAVDGMLTVRPVTTLTLAADHRATDGFSGSRLLSTITRLLNTPEEL